VRIAQRDDLGPIERALVAISAAVVLAVQRVPPRDQARIEDVGDRNVPGGRQRTADGQAARARDLQEHLDQNQRDHQDDALEHHATNHENASGGQHPRRGATG